ncbi:uncharacterized protein LOC116250007 [Nymphaea colorata]|nr:uncharacterized protein LOC116250007 [Nymphaea colorata]
MGKKTARVSALDMPDVPMGQLPEHLQLQRTRVLCASDAPSHTESVQYSGAYAAMGIDNGRGVESFCKNFKVEIIKLTEEMIEFDMVGIDASLANAFRRILLAEVPTMAIEKVFIANNTSVIQDEVLAHRLGLIPVKVDPRLFECLSENDVANEKNTIVFKLHVECKRGGPRLTVKSDQLQWLSNGSEFLKEPSDSSSKPKTYTAFSCDQRSLPEFSNNAVTVQDPDIIIAKLGPGQIIELEAHAVKGIGKTHAKWSPVATAWYRMLPEVVLLKDVVGDKAEQLVAKCPVKVFDIEDLGGGNKKAVVTNSRACTLCRECIRKEERTASAGNEDDEKKEESDAEDKEEETDSAFDWSQVVQLHRIKDHFIFTIESTGALPPEVLLTEAVKILEEKCEQIIIELS